MVPLQKRSNISKILTITIQSLSINSSHLSAAYIRQGSGSEFIQVMACRLTAPSHYLNHCWLIVNWTLGNKLQRHFIQNKISFTKIHLKMSSAKWRPFCPGGDELKGELWGLWYEFNVWAMCYLWICIIENDVSLDAMGETRSFFFIILYNLFGMNISYKSHY